MDSMKQNPIDISYLILAPYKPKTPAGKPTAFKKPIYAPYFFDVDIEFVLLEAKKVKIGSVDVGIEIEVLDGEVLAAQCSYLLEDGLSEAGLKEKDEINKKLYNMVIEDMGIKDNLVEEYAALLIKDLKTSPEEYVKANKYLLARMAKSLEQKIDDSEVEDILSSYANYSKSDMTIIDWETAIIIAKAGDVESDLELIKIGNYQLIRYRMLDRLLNQRIADMSALIDSPKSGIFRRDKDMLRKVVRSQIELILHFDKIDQSLLLIGDWYSAKLYRMIIKELYIEQWKANVKEKLNTLTSIDEIVRNSLTFSWSRVLEAFQTGGWILLLLGYFVLFFLELQR